MKTMSDYLCDTKQTHSDMLDAVAYLIAANEFKLKNKYYLLYINKKPKYLPNFIYKWIVSKIVNVAIMK